MSLSSSRQTILPQGRPFLIDEKPSSDLLYLSWGTRTYGISPIPVTRHEGWVYLLVRSGSPLLLRPGQAPKRIQCGSFLIISPDCASGWNDTGHRQCDILTWLWRENPRIEGMKKDICAIFCLEKKAIQHLRTIHQRCREQISQPDLFTSRTLHAFRELIEIELERSRLRKNSPSQSRLEFALPWLERHGHEPRAVSQLAEYLQISHSTLDRLFQRELGMSVAAWLHEQKMAHAAALIREGKLRRKEIAFELGYRHANDFSRAWSKWASHQRSICSVETSMSR